MPNDLYMKSVLTVIAACLVAIVLKEVPLVSTAHAQGRNPYNVHDVMSGRTETVRVDIVALGGYDFRPGQISIGGPVLPVKMQD